MSRIGPSSLEIHAETPDMLKLRDSAMGRTKTILFSSESNPSHLTWQDPQRRVFHVIDCSGKFITVEQASAHIHTAYHTANDDARGALKVLIAAATTDAPRFYPGINLRDYRVEQSIFACAPPGGDTGTINDDAWEYASHVLDLLSRLSFHRLLLAALTRIYNAQILHFLGMVQRPAFPCCKKRATRGRFCREARACL